MNPVPVPHRLHMPTSEIGSPYNFTAQKAHDHLERAHDLAAEQLQAYAGYPEFQAEILAEAVSDVRFSDEVDAATVRIGSFVTRSNLYEYSGLTIKDETEQLTKAYKIRGAANFILKNVERADYTKVVTGSAGNHGQAVALVASSLGLTAIVVVPRGAPKTKIDAIKAHGGEVFVFGADYTESTVKALELNELYGGIYVPAFNHFDTMAGQGTVAKEFLDQKPDMTNLIVPTGGGGLLAACAKYCAVNAPQIKVFGAGVRDGSSVETAFKHGNHKQTTPNKFADGIAVRQLGSLTWPEVKRHARGALTADELSVRQTIGELSLRGHDLEGAGAVGIAAALAHRQSLSGPTAVIATGGNIDPSELAKCVAVVKPETEPLTKTVQFSIM